LRILRRSLNELLWRLRWVLNPGNDLFLVFNQGWEQQLGGLTFRRVGTRVTGKVQYTFRF
jgi:hypothetical protein